MSRMILTSNGFYTTDEYVGLEDFTGLGVTEISIFPHYDREDLFIVETEKTIEDRIRTFEQDNQRKITRLKDVDYVIV